MLETYFIRSCYNKIYFENSILFLCTFFFYKNGRLIWLSFQPYFLNQVHTRIWYKARHQGKNEIPEVREEEDRVSLHVLLAFFIFEIVRKAKNIVMAKIFCRGNMSTKCANNSKRQHFNGNKYYYYCNTFVRFFLFQVARCISPITE